jgi:hypothetical protein
MKPKKPNPTSAKNLKTDNKTTDNKQPSTHTGQQTTGN